MGKARNRTTPKAIRDSVVEKRPVCDICSVFVDIGAHKLCEQIRKDKSFSNVLKDKETYKKNFKNVDIDRRRNFESEIMAYELMKQKRTRIVCDVCRVPSDGLTNHSYCKTLLRNFHRKKQEVDKFVSTNPIEVNHEMSKFRKIAPKGEGLEPPAPQENSQICDICQMSFEDSETDHNFCFQFRQKIQYFKDQKVKAEILKRELEVEEEKALVSQEEMPQVLFDKYPCPIQNCKFVSLKKYNGIRIHLLKHFKERIQRDALQNDWMTDYNERHTCFNKTSCNTDKLLQSGELVHHYGLLHCLVDDILQEYALNRIKLKYKDHFQRNLCPYEDYTFSDYTDLQTHLINSHYFNMILDEVKVMLDFNSLYGKHRYTQKKIKCPYCKKRFNNLLSTGKAKDVTEIVLHCGLDHGYAAYYLLADTNIDQMKELLTQYNVKQEPDDEEMNNVDQDALHGAVEDEESDINNFLQVQVQDIKSEVPEDGEDMQENLDTIVKQEAIEEDDIEFGIASNQLTKSEPKSADASDCILGI